MVVDPNFVLVMNICKPVEEMGCLSTLGNMTIMLTLSTKIIHVDIIAIKPSLQETSILQVEIVSMHLVHVVAHTEKIDIINAIVENIVSI